jgi:CPA2 family monovalent cation:H+ antiporter-2
MGLVTANFLEDMAVVMCVAAIATVVCQLLKQPLVVGYLIAGIVVGPHVPGVYANMDRVPLVAEMGVTLLVFSIGLEFRFRKLRRLAPTAGLVALLQIGFMMLLGYAVGRVMGWTPWQSLLCGSVISISGAVIVAKAFEEVRVDDRVRELVLGIVLCEDVMSILLLAVLTTAAKSGAFSVHRLSKTAAFLGVFVVAVIAAGFVVIPRLIRHVAGLRRAETLLITSLGLCFGLAMIAERVGYSAALGAFLAGSLVAESGLGTEVEWLIRPVRDMFCAMFFVAVGMMIDPHALATYWPAWVLLTVLVIVGKIIGVSFASLLIGEPPHTAVQAGFAMAQIGVFSFLIAEIGSGNGVPHTFLYTLAVGTSAITAFLCPTLIRASIPAGQWVTRKLPKPLQSSLAEYSHRWDRLRRSPEPEE